MALLVGGRFKVETAAGVAVSGGKVRIYDTGTTNLSTVYSNAALSTPLTNPVVAAADGWTVQIFAADGLAVDVDFLTAADVVISGQSLTASVFVGSTGSELERDFGNARFQVRGSGGTVFIEGGPPTGDDTGGTTQIGGWDGTDADAITLKGPTDVDSDTFTINSRGLPANVNTGKTAFSGATTVDIALPNAPTGIRAYEVTVWDVAILADTTITGRLSYDSGSTYKSGASDYQSDGAAVATSMAFAGENLDEPLSAYGMCFRFLIITDDSPSTRPTLVAGTLNGAYATTSQPKTYNFTNYGLGGYGRATHLRLISGSGNISGKYRVVGLRDFN